MVWIFLGAPCWWMWWLKHLLPFWGRHQKNDPFSTSIAKSIFSCAVWASVAVSPTAASATHNFVSTLGWFEIILEMLLSLGFLLIFLGTGCICTFKCTFVSMLADFIDKSINFLTWFLLELVELVMKEYLVLRWLVSFLKLFYHSIKISRFYLGHILVVFSFKIRF